MIGVLIDRRYETIKLLGEGAFGQTFLATDTKRPGHPYCVIKQLRYLSTNLQAVEYARRLFKKEAEILEKLGHHDQIPTLLADIEEDQEFYLVEQFIPGHSLLYEMRPGQGWSEPQVIRLLVDVLKILAFVHGQGVIHRDLKPANLMRRESDGKIVLIDFGAVKELESQIVQGQHAPTVAVGTPGYMPIEQFNGQPQFNSDIYTLGVIAIQALLGLPANELSGLKDPGSTPPGEFKWRDRRSVSPQLADILDNMVRSDFRQRYPSAKAVLADLARLGVKLSASATQAHAATATTILKTGATSTATIARPQINGKTNGNSNTSPQAHSTPKAASHPHIADIPATPQPANPSQPSAQPSSKSSKSPKSPSKRSSKQWVSTSLAALFALSGLAVAGYSQKGLAAEFFYNQGREKARYGDIKGALDNFDRAIQIEPTHANAYARRCGTRLNLEDNEGAKSDCQRALVLDPNNSIAYLNWGNIYAEDRNQDEATQNYTRAVELSSRDIQLDPDNADAYYHRGAARLRLNDYTGAIEDTTQAIELDPEYTNAYVARCQANGLLSNHDQAIQDCQQAIEINPNFYAAYTSLCNRLSNAGQHQEATEACTKALQINPNDSHAYSNRGVVWYRLGDYEAAINDYRQAIQRDPNDAVAQLNLGDVLTIQGDRQGAIDAYNKAIEINSSFAAAYYARGVRQWELGNLDAAINDLQQAADLFTQQEKGDRAEDASYQIRKIQESIAATQAAAAPPEPEAPAPETSEAPPPETTAAVDVVPEFEAPPAETFAPQAEPSVEPPPIQPDPYVQEPPAPYIAPDPYVQEPPAPYYDWEPDPYVQEPPAPYIAPDPYVQEPYVPYDYAEPDPYVQEPPVPYSAPYDPQSSQPPESFGEPSFQQPPARYPGRPY